MSPLTVHVHFHDFSMYFHCCLSLHSTLAINLLSSLSCSFLFIQEAARSWTFVRWPSKPSEGNPVAADMAVVVSKCFHGRATAYSYEWYGIG